MSLHAFRHTCPTRRIIYFVPDGTILDPAHTLRELTRRASSEGFGFTSGSKTGFAPDSMFQSVADLPVMSASGIHIFMHGGANALEWFVRPGAKFTNPSTWLDYFTYREWVFQVIYANAFRGMNDKILPILNSEKFKFADPVYLLWWFGHCNYEYNRLTRIRYEREDPRHPLAISDIAGCMDLWDAMVCAIGKKPRS